MPSTTMTRNDDPSTPVTRRVSADLALGLTLLGVVIVGRLLRDVAENREVGDATTLADSGIMDKITAGMKTAKDED